ncbi:MAG: hypothetical protein M1816_000119 [Peltula sp. TS41687]|nr:MAG: hypothetical protein M1816_000119 [Peltula sp. TS41687]
MASSTQGGDTRQDAQRASPWRILPLTGKDMKTFRSPVLRALQRQNQSGQDQSESDTLDLKTLNDSLELLTAVFPDVQIEVFREMLLSFTEESRLHIVTEALLKQKAQWVRGRWRTAKKEHSKVEDVRFPVEVAGVPAAERFRSNAYKKAVRMAFYHEFRGLPRSTVEAVLAEHNYSYTLTRPTLLTMSSKLWWLSISSFLFRRKTTASAAPADHPFVVWDSVGKPPSTSRIPALRCTGSDELDDELLETLIRPLKRGLIEEQELKDGELAVRLNEAEAQDCHALQDCECCFTATTFEQLSTCDRGCHFICFRCIRQTINEALFGQGWTRVVDAQRGTIRCIAPTSDDNGDCGGCISTAYLHRALSEEKGGKDILRKFEDTLATEALIKSDAFLIRCPFCVYAEAEACHDISQRWRFRRTHAFSTSELSFLVLSGCLLSFFLPFVFRLILIFSLLYLITFGPTQIKHSLVRLSRKRRGLKFTCLSHTCGRSSCISCGREWRDIHICYESEQLALRAHVERAMAEAVKRTCPRCNLSFIKASGCNKLTCNCGYRMCYVCRSEIGVNGYRHFCEHFRPLGQGPCSQCDKCDLWRCEDEDVAAKRAAELAEKEWRMENGIQGKITWDGKGELAPSYAGKMQGWWRGVFGHQSGWEDVVDGVVDRLIEVV